MTVLRNPTRAKILAFALSFFLFNCGTSNTNKPTAPKAVTAKQTQKITVTIPPAKTIGAVNGRKKATQTTVTLNPGDALNIVAAMPVVEPSFTQTFSQYVSANSMALVTDYEFGYGTGTNVHSITDPNFTSNWTPYGIAGTTPINSQWQRFKTFNTTNYQFTSNTLNLVAVIPTTGGGLFNGGISSGQLASNAVYQPGLTGASVYAFETYEQVPNGAGTWPADWLYTKQPGVNDESEIDKEFFVMQYQNQYDWTGFNHGAGVGPDNYSIQTNQYVWHPGTDFSASMVLYQIIWTPNTVSKYVNGTLVKQTQFKWTSGGPAQFLISNQVGSDSVGPGLIPNSTAEFPAHTTLRIGHYKVWSK